MTGKQKVGYFFLSLLIFVVLAALEFFFCGRLIDYIYNTWQAHLIAFILMLVLFNPFIVYKIMEKVPFKVKGLKVAGGINEALRQKSDIEE